MHTTSLTLLNQIQRNDPQGWERFVSIYFPMLCGWAKSQAFNESECEDVAQRVLQIVVVQAPTFAYDNQRRGFRAWLKTIARREAISVMRKRRPANTDFAEYEPDDNSQEEEMERTFDQQHARYVVYSQIEPLRSEFSEQAWTAFWETTRNSRPAQDVAKELNITPEYVHVLKGRVLKRLRQQLRDLLE